MVSIFDFRSTQKQTFCKGPAKCVRRVWRYQRDNQNPYIEEEQTIQCPKGKVHNDKQWSTKHTYKTKDRITRTPLKTGGELRCSGRVSSSCSTSKIVWFCSIGACPNPWPGFPTSYVMVFFYVQWVEVRGNCSFCWYGWHCWASLLKLSFHKLMHL